jgi:hypothetical protein
MRYFEIAHRPEAQIATDQTTLHKPRYLQDRVGKFGQTSRRSRVSRQAAKAKPHSAAKDSRHAPARRLGGSRGVW